MNRTRAPIRRRATDAICIAWLLLVTIATGHLILKTALAMPDLIDQAEAARGM